MAKIFQSFGTPYILNRAQSPNHGKHPNKVGARDYIKLVHRDLMTKLSRSKSKCKNHNRPQSYHDLATSDFVGIIIKSFISKGLTNQMQNHNKLQN